MNRAETLQTAEKMVCGHREHDYGSPEDSFTEIGKLWEAYKDVPFTPHDVAVMMSLLKIARIKNGSAVEDSYVDGCGYLACAAEIGTEERADQKKEPQSFETWGEDVTWVTLGWKQWTFSGGSFDRLHMGMVKIRQMLDAHGSVAVRDVFTLLGVPPIGNTEDYGWVTLPEMMHIEHNAETNRWELIFPKPVCLDI